MIKHARASLKSWMFVYAGMVAAIALSGHPAGGGSSAADIAPTPAVETTVPLSRYDI